MCRPWPSLLQFTSFAKKCMSHLSRLRPSRRDCHLCRHICDYYYYSKAHSCFNLNSRFPISLVYYTTYFLVGKCMHERTRSSAVFLASWFKDTWSLSSVLYWSNGNNRVNITTTVYYSSIYNIYTSEEGTSMKRTTGVVRITLAKLLTVFFTLCRLHPRDILLQKRGGGPFCALKKYYVYYYYSSGTSKKEFLLYYFYVLL